MRALQSLSQWALWVTALAGVIAVDDLTIGAWAPLTVLAVALVASLGISRAFRATPGVVRHPRCFSRPSHNETSDYASHAAMSPGVGAIAR